MGDKRRGTQEKFLQSPRESDKLTFVFQIGQWFGEAGVASLHGTTVFENLTEIAGEEKVSLKQCRADRVHAPRGRIRDN